MAQTAGNGAAPDDGRVTITVDGREVRVPPGTLVLDAAAEAGIHIPIYCSHPKMDPVAVCRMCLVEVEKFPKLQPACATYVAEGMVVRTATDQVRRVREGMLEFLLINHPLDCPVCDRGGECDLQDFTFRYGPGTSRFPITDKVHFDKAVPLSDRIELDQERCILCWRCVRYYDEITGEKEIVLQERGVHTLVGTFEGRSLTSAFQGNLPEVCPVGALTHRQYRFAARPWDLQRTRGVCPECSYGCNVNVDSRDYEVKRFASRDNPLVDDMWLCDRGRYSATSWNDTARVRRAAVREADGRRRETGTAEAVAAAAANLGRVRQAHGPNAMAVLGSAESTNEELWLLQRLAREVFGTPHIDHRLDPLPGLKPSEHALGIAEIEECAAVVVLGEEPERQAPVLTLRLFKAQRKRGVQVLRVASGTAAPEIVQQLSGTGRVGIVADEEERDHAALVAAAVTRAGRPAARLTVTRGVNGRGAKDMGVTPGLLPGYRPAPRQGLSGREILAAASAGGVRGLLLLESGRGLRGSDDLLRRALRGAEVSVAIETRPGPASEMATVVLPGHALLEKQGTVTNVEGRVQRIRQALPAVTASPSETRLLAMIAARMGAEGWNPTDPTVVHRALCEAVPEYAAAGNGGRALWDAAAAAP